MATTKATSMPAAAARDDDMERCANELAAAVARLGFQHPEVQALLEKLTALGFTDGLAASGTALRPLPSSKQDVSRRPVLNKPRHPQRDFFVADIFDAAPKDDVASMEHPLFALKSGDRRVRKYQRGDVSIEVRPGLKGLATIHDKDVWIYCISQLVEAMNRGRVEDISRTVQFTAYDFLVTTNRQTSGAGYRLLANALERLRETSIITNVETAGKRERSGFGLLDSFRVIERDADNRMVAVSVTLSDWLFRAVESKQVLTLSRDYFRLRKPLDRRIYELARKHCGKQASWRVTVTTLREKSGTTAPLRNFRGAVKLLASTDELPDYRLTFDHAADAVTFYRRHAVSDAHP